MTSLRVRAVLGGLIWVAFSLALGTFGILTFVNNLSERRFDEALVERQLQVLVALSSSEGDEEALESFLTDPGYRRPYSGRYWQLRKTTGQLLTSRSLLDGLLRMREPDATDPELWQGRGPDDEPLRGIIQRVTLDNGDGWLVLVADSETKLSEEKAQVRRSVLLAFGILGVIGVAALATQIATVLHPLSKLRSDVLHRWDKGQSLDPGEYPTEVAPLVTDINTLLARNHDTVSRSRRQAADLAHALKTPSAILRNELHALQNGGTETTRALSALDRVDAQVSRSLARMRASFSGQAAFKPLDVTSVAERLGRALSKIAEMSGKTISLDVEPGLDLQGDAQDIEEILGILLDNAIKWAGQHVRLAVHRQNDHIIFTIEDDGPGISPKQRSFVLQPGSRLDTSEAGNGLGLAIVNDLCAAYGGTFALETSDELGGLEARCTLPRRRLAA